MPYSNFASEYKVIDENSFRCSLLNKYSWPLYITICLLYAVLQTSMGLSHFYSNRPVCNSNIQLKPWVQSVNLGTSFVFIVNGIFQLIRMMKFKSQSSNKEVTMFQISSALLSISIIARRVLESSTVEGKSPVGKKRKLQDLIQFDPNMHNAVMHVEDKAYGENAIVEVLQKGYQKNNKVIRYSMVKVAN
jgi:hypothetical protein